MTTTADEQVITLNLSNADLLIIEEGLNAIEYPNECVFEICACKAGTCRFEKRNDLCERIFAAWNEGTR